MINILNFCLQNSSKWEANKLTLAESLQETTEIQNSAEVIDEITQRVYFLVDEEGQSKERTTHRGINRVWEVIRKYIKYEYLRVKKHLKICKLKTMLC